MERAEKIGLGASATAHLLLLLALSLGILAHPRPLPDMHEAMDVELVSAAPTVTKRRWRRPLFGAARAGGAGPAAADLRRSTAETAARAEPQAEGPNQSRRQPETESRWSKPKPEVKPAKPKPGNLTRAGKAQAGEAQTRAGKPKA